MSIKNYCLVCGGTGCEAGKADDIYKRLLNAADAHGISDQVQIVKTGCFGLCEKGPIVKVLPEEAFYVEVKPEDAETIVAEHFVKGRVVTSLLYKQDGVDTRDMDEIKFYQKSEHLRV